jgi:hypothetical protein
MPRVQAATTTAPTAEVSPPKAAMSSTPTGQKHSREDLALAEQLSMLHKSSSSELRQVGSTDAQQDASSANVGAEPAEAPTTTDPQPTEETPEYHALEDSLRRQARQQEQNAPSPLSDREATSPQPHRSHVSTAPISGQICR